ncbi:DUF3592 domain-containing protein [Micromonospora sp. PLK6-60]|uniref:DUF3592 domain-containing protein n=1 Tax=Micromonospora sp. PLK6-60 TaxID=2873383 RepID=UPI001CA6A967|nr:DUF3592 domain-containing protein [Micromonospora sp. PLK6-60]MBY8874454.1 DUF3592 domain-containing protein [Micromonospora sp. PLK6-60]
MPTVLLTIMTVLALAGAAYAVIRLRRDLRLLARGTRVPGEVVDLRPVTLGHGPRTYYPVVRYRTPDGRDLTATPGRWRQTPLSGAPGPVTVVLDPARPTRILVEAPGIGTSSVVVPFVTLLGVSVIVLAAGIVAYTSLS